MENPVKQMCIQICGSYNANISHLTILYHVANTYTNHLYISHRFESLVRYEYDTDTWEIARNGFGYFDGGHIKCCCCGAEEQKNVKRYYHKPTCSYPLFLYSESTDIAHPFTECYNHLVTEWKHNRIKAAMDCGYRPEHIIIALIARYQAYNRTFYNTMQMMGKVLDVTKDYGIFDTKLSPFARQFMRLIYEDSPHIRREKLLKETMELSLDQRCRICHDREADLLIYDCGHVAMCEFCKSKTSQCPRCKTTITNMMKVYF